MQSLRRLVLAAWVMSIVLAVPALAQSVPDFTFIHATDVHAPLAPSAEVISQIQKLGGIDMSAYNIKVPAPSFVVVSGDMTEFGGGDGAWDAYMSYWKGFTIPVYHTGGNHDGPWFANRPHLRKLYDGRCSWSFDKSGCHFIGLDSSTPQCPRANITEEQITWLKEDLKKVKPETPVFLVIHHPLNDSGYWSSPYAVSRFIDPLRSYNLVAVLMGHGHSANCQNWYGIDNVMGGATVGPSGPGFSVGSVQNGVLRFAYMLKDGTAAAKPLLEKPLPARSGYPKIEILSPSENGIRRTGQMMVRAKISGNNKPIVKAVWSVDNETFQKTPGKDEDFNANPMEVHDGVYEAEVHYQELVPGAHYIQVAFTDSSGGHFTKCVRFGAEPEPSRLVWRAFLGGSCRGSATVAGNLVFAGATDMKLYALDKATGQVKWSYLTQGDVCTKPLVVGDAVYFGSGDGKLYAVTTSGKLKWAFAAKEGIYSSPIYSDGLVLFGSNDAHFYAVDAQTGKQAWVCSDPAYTIMVKPFLDNGIVYFGAWDQYLYAVDAKTGQLKWKCMGYGSQTEKGAKRYYSPANCGPVVSAGKVFVADRDSYLNIIDATGAVTKNERNCIATGISEDGKSVYVRKPGDGIEKLDADGNKVWSAPAEADSIFTAPVEKDGIVYTVSRQGLVQALKASDGSSLWEYQATPLMYVLSEVEAANGVAYVTGMDGSVTAIKVK
jgi:outer membrane protein assembly factor BamB